MSGRIARFTGVLELGGREIDCYVLNDGERVISSKSAVGAITKTNSGALAEYIGVKSLKPFIDKGSILAGFHDFEIPGTQFIGKGITADNFLNICHAYIAAMSDPQTRLTKRQLEIAIQCSAIVAGCAHVGLIALIDEATGYQSVRDNDALQVKLNAFLAEELQAWEKMFPDELWQQFGRLTNWAGSLTHRPKWWGKLVMELIYDALDEDVANYLRNNKPPPKFQQNYHQWLTKDFGAKHLDRHIHQVIGMARACDSMKELRSQVRHHFKGDGIQTGIRFPKSFGEN